MRYDSKLVIVAMATGAMAATVFGQASKPASSPATGPADEVAVIVNGQNVMESQIDEVLSNGREMTKEQMAEMRQRVKPQMAQLMDFMIDNELVTQEAKKAGITLQDADLDVEMEKSFQNLLKSRNTTKEDAAQQIKAQYNKTLEEFLKERARSTGFKVSVLRDRLIAKKYADDTKVTDEDVKNYYEKNKETKYSHPEEVKASHILLGTQDPQTRKPLSDDDKKAKRKKAEEVLAEVKKPGADFAALAKEHSSCPSKKDGGDLGFFARERMVPPFSEAAFKMKVGDISDVVETNFGYHIIKVTDRRPAGSVPFDDVKDQIREEREQEKNQAVQMRFKQDLRKDAKIVYPPGKELATRPSPMTRPAMTRPAMTRPAMTRPARMPMTRPAAGQIRVLPPTQSKPQK